MVSEQTYDDAVVELGKVLLALAFYRRMALDGVRVTEAIDAAFLDAAGLEL